MINKFQHVSRRKTKDTSDEKLENVFLRGSYFQALYSRLASLLKAGFDMLDIATFTQSQTRKKLVASSLEAVHISVTV